MYDLAFDFLRGVNIVISALLLLRLLMLRRKRWRWLYTSRDKMNWHAFVGIGVTSLVGSGENIWQDNPPGSRTLLTTLTLIFVWWTTKMPLNETRPIQRVERDEEMRGKQSGIDQGKRDHSSE